MTLALSMSLPQGTWERISFTQSSADFSNTEAFSGEGEWALPDAILGRPHPRFQWLNH